MSTGLLCLALALPAAAQALPPTVAAALKKAAKGRAQWAFYKGDGATWTAPTAMSNFLREVHIAKGGQLKLPFHGDGSKMGIEEGVIAPGLGV